MKRLCCVLLLLMLTGCVGEKAPPRPVLRFENTPVSLTQGDFALHGALTFGGVDGVKLTVESPPALQGFVFELRQGEMSITRGSVTVPGQTGGCVGELLQAVRRFELEEIVFQNGTWQLSGEEIFLTADAAGVPQGMWGGDWQADFWETE